ncbi:hypothetical protein BaRGS_00034105, partial [Batillaria attramentaria]
MATAQSLSSSPDAVVTVTARTHTMPMGVCTVAADISKIGCNQQQVYRAGHRNIKTEGFKLGQNEQVCAQLHLVGKVSQQNWNHIRTRDGDAPFREHQWNTDDADTFSATWVLESTTDDPPTNICICIKIYTQGDRERTLLTIPIE